MLNLFHDLEHLFIFVILWFAIVIINSGAKALISPILTQRSFSVPVVTFTQGPLPLIFESLLFLDLQTKLLVLNLRLVFLNLI